MMNRNSRGRSSKNDEAGERVDENMDKMLVIN